MITTVEHALLKRPYAVFAALVVTLCSGCADPEDVTAPFQARIMTSEDGVYQIRTASFQTLEDIKTVNGSLAQLIGRASMRIPQDLEERARRGEEINLSMQESAPISFQFSVQDGVVYPHDYAGMELLSIYYGYEQTFLFWQENLGLDIDDFGKLKIFHAPTIGIDSAEFSIEQTVRLNAAFLPGDRHFLFFDTSPFEEVPLNINLAVIAHEFSHAIFDVRFANKNRRFYDTEYEAAAKVLSGINEGVADYFAYMVTGQPDEIGQSLFILARDRDLPVDWTDSQVSQQRCADSFYCRGSVLASALYEVAQNPGFSKLSVGLTLYDALEGFATDWTDLRQEPSFDYPDFLRRVLLTAPEDQRSVYCQSFIKWFDRDGHAERMGCL